MKKLDTEQLKDQLTKLLAFVHKYAVLGFVLISLGIFGFLVYRVRTLVSNEPSDDAVEAKLNETKSVKIDRSSVEKIQKLQATNVEVKALFDQARDNPFQE